MSAPPLVRSAPWGISRRAEVKVAAVLPCNLVNTGRFRPPMDGAPAFSQSMPLHFEQYRALVEHAPILVWRAGIDGHCNYVNSTWLAFTGRTLEEELGWGWTTGIHPDDRAGCLSKYVECLARRETFEINYRLRRHDGVYRYIMDRGVPCNDPSGAFDGFVGSCIDVHDRHMHDEVSGAAEFFEMSLDQLCVAGFDGYMKRVNPAWTRVLGWSSQELTSRPSIEFVHPDDRESTLAGRQRLREGSSMGPLVNRYLCKDGSFRWFEWRSVSDVERELVYAAARDITAEKEAGERLVDAQELQARLQRQLIFAERMASVGTLAAGVAHEINNPLAYVITNLSLMSEDLRAGSADVTPAKVAEWREMAAEAQLGADRIRKIVRGLKTLSRVDEERRTVVDIHALLELSINMTFNEIRHRARLVKDYGKIPLVEADDARLGQVFINLLINAAQALPDGGSATNEIRIVTSTDPNGRAIIEVRDTGMGISEALLGRIFDPFFTTKPVGVGTGLGLSICHSIVSALSGEITVSSQEGHGTTFRVALPAAARSATRAGPSLPRKAPVVSAAVLVVDDEPAVGNVLRRLLRDHRVTVVTKAKQALELLTSGTQFDVILSDLMMPDMSGMELYDVLAQRFPTLAERMVFVSGGAFTPLADAFLERVSNVLLDKPFDAHRVREVVQRYAR